MKNHQKEKIVDLIEYKEEKANSRFILKGIETGMLLVALKKVIYYQSTFQTVTQ